MLKFQTKLPEFQAYVGTFAMICLQQAKLIPKGDKQHAYAIDKSSQ